MQKDCEMCYFLNMETVNILMLVSAIVLILLLWAIVGVRHLKYLRKAIGGQWEVVDTGLQRRHNLLPNLIETVRNYRDDSAELMDRMIRERIKAAKMASPGAEKIEVEHDLSKTIDEVIALSDGGELARDTNFLELRKEIDDLEENIEKKVKKYNEMIRAYNKQRKGILLRLLSSIFRFKEKNIFEVEI